MEIILMRHGKPKLPSLKRLSAAAFSAWVEAYDRAGLARTAEPTPAAINIAAQCHALVCSELPRSIESARALTVKSISLSAPCFNEAGLPVAAWRYPKFTPQAWAVIFRLGWLLGYSHNTETYRAAKKRAAEAADILKTMAKTHQRVLLVGHGVHNRLIAKDLRTAGWKGPLSPGSRHWGFGVYRSPRLPSGG